MREQIKQQWCEALRSGEYRQIFGRMRSQSNKNDQNCFCAVGLLYKITKAFDYFDYNRFLQGKPYDNKVLELTGFTMKELRDIAYLNDDKAYSFKQIADYIEENL